jgi:hypothetical protein
VKPLPDKKSVWVTVLICVIVVLLVSSLILRKHRVGLEPFYILEFMVFLYFIPDITTQKKAVIYSIIIPFFCAAMLAITLDITFFSEGRIPFYFFGSAGNIIYAFIRERFFIPYIASFSWVVSFFMILAYELCFYISKQNKSREKKQDITPTSFLQKAVMEMRLFRHGKLTISAIFIYFLFITIYFRFYKTLWLEDIPTEWTYKLFIYVCALSFVSLFLFAPVMIGQLKRTIAFCVLAPLVWSIIVFILWVALILLFAQYQQIVIESVFSVRIYPQIYRNQITDIFSIYFYLDRYLKTHAWLISFPLLLMCGIYYYLAKSELSRKIDQ